MHPPSPTPLPPTSQLPPPPVLLDTALQMFEPNTRLSLFRQVKLMWSMCLLDGDSYDRLRNHQISFVDCVSRLLTTFCDKMASWTPETAKNNKEVRSINIARMLTIIELTADELPGLIQVLKQVDRALTMLAEQANPVTGSVNSWRSLTRGTIMVGGGSSSEGGAAMKMVSPVGLHEFKQALMLFEQCEYFASRKFSSLYAVHIQAALDGIGRGGVLILWACVFVRVCFECV